MVGRLEALSRSSRRATTATRSVGHGIACPIAGANVRSDAARSTPNGIRTRVTALKGRRPRPLDDGGLPDGPGHLIARALGHRWGDAQRVWLLVERAALAAGDLSGLRGAI